MPCFRIRTTFPSKSKGTRSRSTTEWNHITRKSFNGTTVSIVLPLYFCWLIVCWGMSSSTVFYDDRNPNSLNRSYEILLCKVCSMYSTIFRTRKNFAGFPHFMWFCIILLADLVPAVYIGLRVCFPTLMPFVFSARESHQQLLQDRPDLHLPRFVPSLGFLPILPLFHLHLDHVL